MKKIVARIIAFVMVLTFLSVDFAPALTVSAAPAETASEVAEGEENITIPEEESSEDGIVPEEESETEESTEEISETEEPTEEASSEPESVSEEPESEDMTSEDVSEEVSDESEETASEEEFPEDDAETSEEATDDTSEEESEEPASEEFTGPLVIVDSVELLDEGLAEGRNVGVAIDAKNFPDAGFREFIEKKYDKYPCDGVLDANEIKRITVINVNDNEEIKDLTGIAYLRYLTDLRCKRIGLTKLDVSRNTKLDTIDCNNNNLETLDVTNNVRLKSLVCYANKLINLDVSSNCELYKLDCRGNQLTSLNFGKEMKLVRLGCDDNNLTELDVTNCKRLQTLSCTGNQLAQIDISMNSELIELFLSNNKIAKINLSKNKKLISLYINYNLIQSLDVSACKDLMTLHCRGNQIEKINLQKNVNLYELEIGENRLESLDVSRNHQLKYLFASENLLKELNLEKNYNLYDLNVNYNQLEMLDVKANSKLEIIDFIDNRLTHMNLQENPKIRLICLHSEKVNQSPDRTAYRIELDSQNSVDLSTLPNGFDVSRVVEGSWTNATLKGTVLTMDQTALKRGYVTYKYRCTDTHTLQFALSFNSKELAVALKNKKEILRYTGKACKPKVDVKFGEIELAENIDYTISYKNNIAASVSGANYPAIMIKGKGNYAFEYTQNFSINKLDLSGDLTSQNIVIDNIETKYTGKQIKVKPEVYSSGMLIPAKDLEILYPDTKDGAYKDPGTYTVTIKGRGTNVTGQRNITLKICKSISKVKVTTDQKSYPYNEVTGVVYPNKVTVTDGKTVLKEGVDYTLSYSNHKQAGTATIVVIGKGVYEGTKKATYKITGKKLTASMVKVLNKTLDYDDDYGRIVITENVDYTIKEGDTLLEEGIDFVCIYPKTGPKPGSYKVTFKGIGLYEGSVSKTFKVSKISISDAIIELDQSIYTYDGKNIKASIHLEGYLYGLTEDVDYTVVYVNNKNAASEADAKAPYLYIKGKGGYTGTTKANPVKFTIEKAPLTSLVTLKADDVLYKDKNNNFVTKFTLTEKTTGKKLAKGKDYGKVKYEYKLNGTYTEISSGKCPAEATALRITVYASENGNYSGSISTEYSFYTKQISKAKVQAIAAKEYNGQQVRPLPVVTMTVKNNGKTEIVTLVRGRDYVLEYGANNKVGTGTVIIKGIGDYGGSKTVKFKITKKVIK